MRYGSVCSGHCAATQAWLPLGWTPEFFAEVEAFPSGVLAHRFRAGRPQHYLDPETMPTEAERKEWIANNKELDRMAERGDFGNGTPNLGDFTQINPSDWPGVEWLIGGTPCQDFSIAGGRVGLAGHRGNLSLAFIGFAHDLASTGSLRGGTWENVPGVLSDKKNAFGCFLGALVGHDAPIVSPHRKGRWTDAGVVVGPLARAAWRVLDAQYFGLAQRRRRLFVIFSFGDGPDPVEILFERQGLLRSPPSRHSQGEDVAPTLSARPSRSGGLGTDAELDGGVLPMAFPPTTAHTLRAEGFDASEDGTGRGTPLGPMAFGGNNQSGPIDVATARSAHAGPHGRMDFESETFVVEPVAKTLISHGVKGVGPLDETLLPVASPRLFSAMPMNGGRDFTVRKVGVSQPITAAGPVGGNQGGDFVLQPEPMSFNARQDPDVLTGLTGPLDTDGYTHAIAFDTTQITHPDNRSNPKAGDPCHPLTAEGHPPAIAFNSREDLISSTEVFGALGVIEPQAQAVAFSLRGRDGENEIESEAGEVAPALRTGEGGSSKAFVATALRWAVRRLMPHECERLQGTADDFTLIPWRGRPAKECPDGPRYKVIGNSMAVNVITWLGRRIDAACAPKEP